MAIARRIEHGLFPSRPMTLRRRWVSVTTHATAVLVVAIIHLLVPNPAAVLIVGGGIMSVVYLSLFLREGQRSPLWFNPLTFYFLWYTVSLGLAPMYLGWALPLTGGTIAFSVFIPLDDLATAYVIYLVGSVSLHAGLQLVRPRHKPRGRRTPDDVPLSLEWLMALWAIGVTANLFPAVLKPMGTLGGAFQWLSLSAVCALALTPRKQLRLSAFAFSALVLFGVASQFAVNLLSFSKAAVMYSMLPLVWLFIMRPHLRRLLAVVGTGILFSYFTVIAPVVTYVRRVPAVRQMSRADQFKTFVMAFVDQDAPVQRDLGYQVERFMLRQFDPIPVAFFVAEVDRSGLQMGETMKYATYVFIPRILWPEKPAVSRGAWFSTYLGFSESEAKAETSTGMTASGELYWNFGILGVVAGMLFLGCIVGFLWRMAGVDPRGQPLHMVLYVTTMLSMNNMPEAVTVTVGVVACYLIFGTAFFGMRLLNRRASWPAAARHRPVRLPARSRHL